MRREEGWRPFLFVGRKILQWNKAVDNSLWLGELEL